MTTPIKTLSQYAGQLQDAINRVNILSVESAIATIVTAYWTHKNIYSAGNGGSAAMAAHLHVDCCKGVACDTPLHPRIMDLTSNSSMLTAIANDIGYEEIFSKQLEWSALEGEVLIVISSSGNSPNIIRALEAAKELNMRTIAIVGFDGGQAKDLAEICIHIPSTNYGTVEDSSMAIIHYMAQSIRQRYTEKNPEDIKY